MAGIFGGGGSKDPPKPKPPTPMPDELSPQVVEARRRKTAETMARSGRASTLLSAGYDTYNGRKVG
jgi:hypothetical protein